MSASLASAAHGAAAPPLPSSDVDDASVALLTSEADGATAAADHRAALVTIETRSGWSTRGAASNSRTHLGRAGLASHTFVSSHDSSSLNCLLSASADSMEQVHCATSFAASGGFRRLRIFRTPSRSASVSGAAAATPSIAAPSRKARFGCSRCFASLVSASDRAAFVVAMRFCTSFVRMLHLIS